MCTPRQKAVAILLDRKGEEIGGHGVTDKYDRSGRPIGLGTWAMLFEVVDYRIVASDKIPQGKVLTIWTGLTQLRWPDEDDDSPSGIFESHVTLASGVERYCPEARYDTEAEALVGHVLWLASLVNGEVEGDGDD